MKHIVSWSGGKDSTATIIIAHELGLPIDLIVISLVWFDKKRKIYGEYPEHVEWVLNYAIPLFESWGYEVKVLESKRDYMYWFYHVLEKSSKPERIGKYAGWVIGGKCYMNREKTRPIHAYLKSLDYEYEEYVGIAIDEPKRLQSLLQKKGKRSLLAENNYTEKMCTDKCRQYNLLSPTYDFFKRGGCWFCPNQPIKNFAYLKKHHPDLWGELVELEKEPNKVSENFKYQKSFPQVNALVDDEIKRQESEPVQLTLFDLFEEVKQ